MFGFTKRKNSYIQGGWTGGSRLWRAFNYGQGSNIRWFVAKSVRSRVTRALRGVAKTWQMMMRGRGVTIPPKNDDVIYEEPLRPEWRGCPCSRCSRTSSHTGRCPRWCKVDRNNFPSGWTQILKVIIFFDNDAEDIWHLTFIFNFYVFTFTDCIWSIDAWWRTELVRKPCNF